MIPCTARDHPGFPECGFPDYNFSLISWLSRLKNQLNIFTGLFRPQKASILAGK